MVLLDGEELRLRAWPAAAKPQYCAAAAAAAACATPPTPPMCDTASLSTLGGAEAQSADIAAAAGRMDGDAAAMFAPPDKNDALLPATLAPCGGDRRCSGDGGGMPPTCVRASRSIPIPPASPADALRFIGDIGVVGTLHCSFV